MSAKLKISKSMTAAFVALTILGACASMKKTANKALNALGIIEHIAERPPPEAPDEFKEALEHLSQQRYQQALDLLDVFVRDEPTSAYTQAAQLNAGRALEGLGRWSEASERYRSVALACEGVAPKLQAMALYRLSFCHEARGDDQQTVAVLSDVSRRAAHLPPEVARAELPARLAASYARTGNFDKALEFYKAAEQGIVRLKRDNVKKGSVPDWLPRTLYFMGTMSFRRANWEDFETALRPLARGQTYLLESAELGLAPWSDRAATDLMASYRDLWTIIETAPVPEHSDPLISRRQVQNRQWQRSALMLESLEELRARSAPTQSTHAKPATAQARQVLAFVVDLEKKINGLLAQRPVGEGLTAEAQERQSRVRGVVISPDDTLERRFLESAREARKNEQPRDLPQKVQTGSSEDPNL